MDKKNNKKSVTTNCEDCEYYDYDEELGEEVCSQDLDEDEMYRFVTHQNKGCPYYKYYNEYATVRKQN